MTFCPAFARMPATTPPPAPLPMITVSQSRVFSEETFRVLMGCIPLRGPTRGPG